MQKKRQIEEALLLWANEPDAIKKRLAAIADTTENERIELDAVTKVGQIHGIFIDRSVNENTNINRPEMPASLKDASPEDLIKALTEKLKLSSQGIESVESTKVSE